jgi:hypothetical protein
MPVEPIMQDPFPGGAEALFVGERAHEPSLQRMLLGRTVDRSGASYATTSQKSRRSQRVSKRGFWPQLLWSQAERIASSGLLSDGIRADKEHLRPYEKPESAAALGDPRLHRADTEDAGRTLSSVGGQRPAQRARRLSPWESNSRTDTTTLDLNTVPSRGVYAID